MIKLSEKAVEDFIKIYEREFGVCIDESEARSKASGFLQFFAIIYKGGQIENKDQAENASKTLAKEKDGV